MELQERLKTIGLEIINSYEQRIKLVNALIREAVQRVGDCGREQEELNCRLKESLARHEGMRKKDYDGLMETVLARRKEREEETRLALEKIWREEGEMIDLLKEALSGDCDPAAFQKMRLEVLSRHRAGEREVARSLMRFQLEQEELTALLRKLLSKGRNIRVRDFKGMVKTFGNCDRLIDDEMETIMDEFGKLRREVADQWEGLFSFYEKAVVNE